MGLASKIRNLTRRLQSHGPGKLKVVCGTSSSRRGVGTALIRLWTLHNAARPQFSLCYNPLLASKRLSGIQVGVPGLKRVLIFLLFLLPATVTWLSCGGAPAGAAKTSGLKYRAFVTNTVSAGTESAGVFILDAQNDERAKASPIAAGNTPGIMVVTPNLAQTLVFSGDGTQSSDNQLSFIDNATEQNSAHVTLPGMTQSIVVSPDSSDRLRRRADRAGSGAISRGGRCYFTEYRHFYGRS